GGDDEARVGLVAQPLRLGDHTPPPRPALERRPEEVLVAPGRPAAPPGCLLGPLDLAGDLSGQAGVRARPKRKSTRLVSHQAISPSRAKPESPRSRMRVRGQRPRIWPTMRATSSTAPAAASWLDRLSRAASRWRPQ